MARKPVILNRGILPGPSAVESGKDYVKNTFAAKFINIMMIIIFSAGVVVLIVAGFMIFFSSGDSEMVGKAKRAIFWAITGIIIAAMSYVIVKFIIGLDFGV